MKVIGKKSISNVIYIALQILFVVGIALLIILPIGVFLYFANQIDSVTVENVIYPVLIYISGFPAVIVVYEFIKLFGSLKREKPFVEENGKALKKGSICSFFISLCYLPLVILALIEQDIMLILLTLIIFLIFVVAWIGLYILAELFLQAVSYKEENDLTI